MEIAALSDRARDLRFALALIVLTIVWMIVEGVASLRLGYDADSLLLLGFGVDSVLELVSALVLLWRLSVELCRNATEEQTERAERRAAQVVGFTLYLLAALLVISSGYRLFVTHVMTNTGESAWGILIGLTAKIGMPILAGWKLKVAARLNSRALRADAMEAVTCGYLSVVLTVGLAATRLFGWWWLDSAAALVLVPFLIKEGREAIRGECCCHGQ